MTQPFKKTKKQKEAIKAMSLVRYFMMYGGSRSGKTFLICYIMAVRAMRCKSRHLIVRKSFTDVKRAVFLDTFPKMMKLCFPGVPYAENKTDFFDTFPNGSQVWFGGLDDKDRVEKVLGNEYSTIAPNECSQIAWKSIEVVMTRLAERSDLVNRMIFDCNPPPTSHWTYKVFILKQHPVTGVPLVNAEKYGSILMNPDDNLENIDEEYLNVLEGLSERAKQRFRYGKFVDDVEGALWDYIMLEQAKAKKPGPIKRTVIAVDPAMSNSDTSDAHGIVVVSIDENNEGIVHEDLSTKGSPNTWGNRVVNAYHKYNANCIVAEVNQGGDLVEHLIKTIDPSIKVVKVHASKSKFARAEPVAALYEQGKIAHLGSMPDLEAELTEYVPMNATKSPDRLDALVWGVTYLMIKDERERRVLII